jgi:MFS family permease
MSATTATLGNNYRKLWLATAVSNVGDGVRDTALPLLAAATTRDPALVAGVAFANRLPWLLCALVSGALVDRWDRRTIMGLANAFRTVLMIALGLAVLTGQASVGLLYSVAFMLGAAETLFDNAAHAVLPSVVEVDQLERANGRLESAMLIGNHFLGPALGGLMFAALAASPFLLDGASFAVAALLVLAMRGVFRPKREQGAAPSNLWGDIAEGVRWLWSKSFLRTLTIMSSLINLTLHATYAIFVLFALEVLGLSEAAFGFLLVAEALGSFLGAIVASRISGRFGSGPTIVAAIALAAVTNLVIGAASNAFLVGAMLMLLSVSGVVWNILTTSLRQSVVPDRLLGRVNSAHRFVAWGAIPLGALLGGFLARSFGLRVPFFVAAAVLAVVALGALGVFRSRSLRVRAEGWGWGAPEMALDEDRRAA